MKPLVIFLVLPMLVGGDRALAGRHGAEKRAARKQAALNAARGAFTTHTFGVDHYLVDALAAQKGLRESQAELWVGKRLLAGDHWGAAVGLMKARLQQTHKKLGAAAAQKLAESRVALSAFEKLGFNYAGAGLSEASMMRAGKRLLKNDRYSVAVAAQVAHLRLWNYNKRRSEASLVAEAQKIVTNRALDQVKAHGPKVVRLEPRWCTRISDKEIAHMAEGRGWSIPRTRRWLGKLILKGRTSFAMQTLIREGNPSSDVRSKKLQTLAEDYYRNVALPLTLWELAALANHWNVSDNQARVIIGEKLIKGDKRGADIDARLARNLYKLTIPFKR